MPFSRIQSAQLTGLGAQGVNVEADIHRGLFLFQIVGLPDKAVEESRERVISALRNSLGKNPKAENQKIIISLSPAELKKEGAYFDLAIAVAYLYATEELLSVKKSDDLKTKLFVGELALNGEVKAIRGLISIAEWAKKNNIEELYIPQDNRTEAVLIKGIKIYLVPNLSALFSHLKNEQDLEQSSERVADINPKTNNQIDFGEVRGQQQAKRALTIAAAGGHNIVLFGPPGTGKSMLAKAFRGILPVLNEDEFLEVATIYSSIGLTEEILSREVPIRSPHHSASHVAIIGGGQNLRPGDITLSHRGILYMDEFPEFDRRVLEALREPMEEGAITVARARGSVRYPASFILLAAMNPCPCGYRGSGIKPCTCSTREIARYHKKLSGPIVDRIDLWVPVAHIEYQTLHQDVIKNESLQIKKLVVQTQQLQKERFGKLNSALSSSEIQKKSNLEPQAQTQLQTFAQKLKLSPRVYLRTIKIARTIADLEQSPNIKIDHILEALQYRPKLD